MRCKKVFLVLISASFVLQFSSCKLQEGGMGKKAAIIPYTVIRDYPHDVEAYTQGLVMHEGRLLEGTGMKKQSWLAEIALESGRQLQRTELDDAYFGEGITVLNGKIYQLSWKNRKGFIYDLHTLQPIGEFDYKFEGWGLTHNGAQLIASDGSHKLRYLDSLSLKECRRLSIKEGRKKARQLNELEFIGGYIFANQWKTDYVLLIDPVQEKVVAKLDLSPLVQEVKRTHPEAGELNGIAFDGKSGNILVTGKYWPKIFAIRIQEGAVPQEIIPRIGDNN